jgi:hypothetical protein
MALLGSGAWLEKVRVWGTAFEDTFSLVLSFSFLFSGCQEVSISAAPCPSAMVRHLTGPKTFEALAKISPSSIKIVSFGYLLQ